MSKGNVVNSDPTHLSRAQVRELDRRAIEDYGIPALVLMENAGRGAVDLLLRLGTRGPVAIACGKGNNGGDGLVMARHLANRGVDVQVLLCAPSEQLADAARVNWNIVQRMGLPARVCGNADEADDGLAATNWIVDGLFGTGLQGAVRPPLDRVINAINASGKPVLALDIPSGLDCDSGVPMGPTVRAAHTATFIARKRGFANPSAAAWTGTVHVVDIGIPAQLLSEASA